MLNGRQNRRCSATRPYCLFFILPLAAVLFYYRINMEDSAIDWRHKTWMQYNATKWWSGLKSGIREKISLIGVNWNPSAQDMKTGQTSEPSQLETQQVAENQPTPACLSPYIVAYPSEYHFIINEPTKCEEQKPFVALMVPVAPHNRRHRDIIRNTWGGESVVLGKVVNVFFLMGLHTGEPVEELEEHLQQESKEHEDLIQSNFLDCYNNLTIKTMVILEWLNSYCSTATYAMKIDSDTYLSVRNLITMLSTAPKTNYMTGLVAREAAVLRDPTSKWYLPVNIYPKPLYPRYALGLGYVLSMDLPKRLVEATRHVKAIYIEDVYLGLCMEYLGIPPTDPPNWDYFHVFPVPYNRCAYSKLVVTTLDGDTNLTWVWKDLHKAGKAC
ncbi:beta-1,3-galactosyltransferase 1-like [Phyllopteryx taeniolatus]|uniref:beta-1,3-galactosyltransferase 1-like n=1 Tax=Phyllopteryx taeniolatus TaxID=161469 RepID=UPI002AD31A53|nr:beta-1,3-galactosyltransferase 1-like [Phyllopteryx taeniolatus]XP_061622265.1 beta-1,3-galactosyltransferase 1-like [Phyllopteryx taeniolatus]XP_061622266.1 beta-1,3-galactosyltransferase 1-like [Phyllopteryx taeniolatus]